MEKYNEELSVPHYLFDWGRLDMFIDDERFHCISLFLWVICEHQFLNS